MPNRNQRLKHALQWAAVREQLELVNGWIYFITCEQFTKIGISANDPLGRLGSMQIGNPFKLTLIARFRVNDPLQHERLLHDLFAPYWERGEWYKLPQSTVELVAKLSGDDEWLARLKG